MFLLIPFGLLARGLGSIGVRARSLPCVNTLPLRETDAAAIYTSASSSSLALRNGRLRGSITAPGSPSWGESSQVAIRAPQFAHHRLPPVVTGCLKPRGRMGSRCANSERITVPFPDSPIAGPVPNHPCPDTTFIARTHRVSPHICPTSLIPVRMQIYLQRRLSVAHWLGEEGQKPQGTRTLLTRILCTRLRSADVPS